MKVKALSNRLARSADNCCPVRAVASFGSTFVTSATNACCDTPGWADTTIAETCAGLSDSSCCAVARSNTTSVEPSVAAIPRDTRPTTTG